MQVYILFMLGLLLVGCAAKMSASGEGVKYDTGNNLLDFILVLLTITIGYWIKKALDFRYMKKEEIYKKEIK
jgi:hypothetical protein